MKRHLRTLWPRMLGAAIFAFFAFALLGGMDADTYRTASQQAAIKEQREAMRFAKAAHEICGPGAAFTLTSNPGEIQCVQRRTGKTTQIAKVGQ